jgi:hypothetical protein
MGIAHDVKGRGALCSRKGSAVFDECAADPAALDVGIDEERVEFALSVGSREYGGEADNGAAQFGHEDASGSDLLSR